MRILITNDDGVTAPGIHALLDWTLCALPVILRNAPEEGCFPAGPLDVTVIAQAPKLAPFIPAMRANVASVLGTAPDRISIKATTEERLGFTGAGEGIAAHAVCLLEEA